jgi:hypothetical protein
MRQLTQQQTVSGNSPHTLTFPEAAAQTFERGAPVVLSGGVLQEAAFPIAATGNASLVGVAAMPANGAGASRYESPASGKPVTVWVANDDTLFGVQMNGGVQADVGKLVNVTKTGVLWSADRTTVGAFLVMFIYTEIPTNAVIAVGKFLEGATQMARVA